MRVEFNALTTTPKPAQVDFFPKRYNTCAKIKRSSGGPFLLSSLSTTQIISCLERLDFGEAITYAIVDKNVN